jgi:hypothetical protein
LIQFSHRPGKYLLFSSEKPEIRNAAMIRTKVTTLAPDADPKFSTF